MYLGLKFVENWILFKILCVIFFSLDFHFLVMVEDLTDKFESKPREIVAKKTRNILSFFRNLLSLEVDLMFRFMDLNFPFPFFYFIN